MSSMNQVSKAKDRAKPKAGFPGDAKRRRERIKRAIKANPETLRRLGS